MRQSVENTPIPPNIQKAITFFQQAGLSRLLGKLREKYIEVGQVGGQIVIDDSTPNERRELASFLGKAPYHNTTIKIRLSDIDAALRRSGFACTLPEVLSAFFPDQPLITRKEQRAAHNIHQSDFHVALQTIMLQELDETRGRHWLEQGQHGMEWLYTRYKNTPKDEQERQLQLIRIVAHALNELPNSNAPERLALFAQHTSGNPHMLDADTAAGRLFLLALHDLLSTPAQSTTNENEDAAFSAQPSRDRIEAVRLYANANLLVDTISSNVAAFNLLKATYHNGQIDPLLQAAGARVVLLPLRQIQEWQHITPAKTSIYVCENPQVFEEILARCPPEHTPPSLLCTSGWPSVAAILLLDLLLAQSPANHLYYSGDFDLKGLQIAAYLLARYPGRCHPWRFDADAYTVALHNGGVPASSNELALLNTLPNVFAPLIETIQERGLWAYQEGITHLLSMDVYRL